MAYQPILNTEVQNGAVLDQAILIKVKDNFETLKLTTDAHDIDLINAFDALSSHESTLGSHTTAIATNTAEIDDIKTQDPWITVTSYLGNWTAYEAGVNPTHPPLQYYKDEMGTVHVRGMIRGTAATSMFQFPVGYRPGKYGIYSAISNNALARIDVDITGLMTHSSGGTPSSWMSVAGISWRAEG